MKKIIATILTFIFVLSLTACKENKNTENTTKKTQSSDDIKNAETVVKSFMDEICEFNIEQAKQYISNPGEIPEKISEITSLNNLTEDLSEQIPEELKEYEKDFSKLFDTTIDGLSKTLSYKIIKSEVKENNVIVKIEFISPAESEFENAGNKLAEEAKNQIKIIAEEAFYDGKITEFSSDEETLKIVMPELFSYLNTYLANFTENIKTEPTPIELTVGNQNGNWKVILIDIED